MPQSPPPLPTALRSLSPLLSRDERDEARALLAQGHSVDDVITEIQADRARDAAERSAFIHGEPPVEDSVDLQPSTCRHCQRKIIFEGTWVDPEAPATPEEGDDHIWREGCDESPSFDARHEPVGEEGESPSTPRLDALVSKPLPWEEPGPVNLADAHLLAALRRRVKGSAPEPERPAPGLPALPVTSEERSVLLAALGTYRAGTVTERQWDIATDLMRRLGRLA